MTAPFAHPRPGLDPTASPTLGALDRPGGDGTWQTAPVTDPPADWVAFAAALLDALHHASWAGWSHAAPVTLDVPEAAPESSENTGDEEPACADDEESLDALIDAIMDGRDIDAPSATPVPRPKTIWRPRPVTLLAVLRLARSFSTANNMAEALASPGGLTLLASGSAALDWTLLKLLETATSTAAIWPDTLPTPVVMLAADAVSSGSIDRQRVLADLSTRARDAIEQAEPVVVLTTVAGTTPKPLRNLRPCVKSLAPFDREMLGPMLQWAYPDEEIGSAMEMIPEDLALSRLGPDALTLALRAADATQAARAVRDALTPVRTEGPGLEAFPLPQQVRAPVM
jgi:hypothetical protein